MLPQVIYDFIVFRATDVIDLAVSNSSPISIAVGRIPNVQTAHPIPSKLLPQIEPTRTSDPVADPAIVQVSLPVQRHPSAPLSLHTPASAAPRPVLTPPPADVTFLSQPRSKPPLPPSARPSLSPSSPRSTPTAPGPASRRSTTARPRRARTPSSKRRDRDRDRDKDKDSLAARRERTGRGRKARMGSSRGRDWRPRR